ncbi:MAG: nuclear transport factor 2 family protein [Actinomycetota bacterium]
MSSPLDAGQTADRIAIDDLITNYVHAIDSLDWELMRSVCTADTILDYSATSGPRGTIDEVLPWLQRALGTLSVTHHVVVNRKVTLDADAASARSYLFNPNGVDDGSGGLVMLYLGGYYNDRFVRTTNGWRFSERVLEIAWTQGAFPEGLIKRTPR